jgi:hypothetical protein
MKIRKLFLIVAMMFIVMALKKDETKHVFVIKKDNPATGLTLAWLLPESKVQQIVGPKFKPILKNGRGLLMLFIVTTKKYYLNQNAYENLNLAHIIVPVEGTNAINSPFFISTEGQKINDLLKGHRENKIGDSNKI